MELFFDTETSDKFSFKTARYTDKDFPWVVQLGAVLAEDGIAYAEFNVIVKPNGRLIADGAQRVHNISAELAEKTGVDEESMLCVFLDLMENADCLVAHNFEFDSNIMASSMYNNGFEDEAYDFKGDMGYFCTMKESTDLCKLPGKFGWKWPKLSELYWFLFGEKMVGAHDAMFDIKATMRCYYELKKRGVVK